MTLRAAELCDITKVILRRAQDIFCLLFGNLAPMPIGAGDFVGKNKKITEKGDWYKEKLQTDMIGHRLQDKFPFVSH